VGLQSSTNNPDLIFYDCYDVIPGIGVPNVRVNSADSVAFWNWQGGIELSDIVTVDTKISLMIAAGRLFVNSSDTEGNIIVKGMADLQGETGGTTIDATGLMDNQYIAPAVWDELLSGHTLEGTTGRILSLTSFQNKVWMDSEIGVTGTTFPIGTPNTPSSFGTDALTIAMRENITEFVLNGSFVSTQSVSGYTIGGNSWLQDSFTFNGTYYDNLLFKNLYLTGSPGGFGSNVGFRECYIQDITNFAGQMEACRTRGTITVAEGQDLNGNNMSSEGFQTIIDLQTGTTASTISLKVSAGRYLIKNARPGDALIFTLDGGEIELDSSCTGGFLNVSGVGTLTGDPDALGITTLSNSLLSPSRIADATWNAQLSGYTTPGSMGQTLSGSTAEEVWNYPLP
jgi:hypothetical protein